MDVSLAAYVKLVAMAHADGRLRPEEEELLESYRRALDIPESLARRLRVDGYEADLDRAEGVLGSSEECLQVIQMLAEVAYSDGRFTGRERRRLRRLARSLGVGNLELARLMVGFSRSHLRQRKLTFVMAVVIPVVLISAITLMHLTIKALVAPPAEASSDRGTAQVGATASDAFKEIDKRYNRSVLLIMVWYDMVLDSQRAHGSATGSGFFVTPDGHIATNNHVVRPWSTSSWAQAKKKEGFRLDPDSVRIAAWSSGARIRGEDGRIVLKGAFDTKSGTLELFASAALDKANRDAHSDLALLKATVEGVVTPVEIDTGGSGLERLDPVMVLGFPKGIKILETGLAETSPSTGVIRKAEETVYVTAPISPGNSGAPVFDQNGRAIGVATRIEGDATLGCCLRSRHLVSLLPNATALMSRARAHEQRGFLGAALDVYELCSGLEDHKEVASSAREHRDRLLTRRNREAQRVFAAADEDASVGKDMALAFQRRFGPIWGQVSRDELRASTD